MKVVVKVWPGSPKERVLESEGVLELYIRDPAQNNMANKRVKTILARRFGTSESNVRLMTGARARKKTYEVIV